MAYRWDEDSPWLYREWFHEPAPAADFGIVDAAESHITSSALERHPFFAVAADSADALRLWVSQELVMTGPFSQIVLRAASLFDNVHLRAMVMEVARGEHGSVRGRKAPVAHPWLLHQLRASMGIDERDVYPFAETEEFLEGLSSDCNDPLTALAAIGVGNERLIEPEYSAIKNCFARCCPAATYKPFLDANLNEDAAHARLCYEVASLLVRNVADAESFITAAKRSVERRLRYFDRLYERAASGSS